MPCTKGFYLVTDRIAFVFFSLNGDSWNFDRNVKRHLNRFAFQPMYVFSEWAYLGGMCLILPLRIPVKIHSKGNQNPANGHLRKIICNWLLWSKNLCVNVHLHFVILKIPTWFVNFSSCLSSPPLFFRGQVFFLQLIHDLYYWECEIMMINPR